ncbi:hypothetical protein PR048_005741 [Dryococelus australis]|uniref:Uncharacterized protein n=1 Tax=Dryococelus australis TaxID=614101 RepID=A0ABQ9I923_9NEOP|nr:hypothetical protein PR048_005741 [Dryococelus australis]
MPAGESVTGWPLTFRHAANLCHRFAGVWHVSGSFATVFSSVLFLGVVLVRKPERRERVASGPLASLLRCDQIVSVQVFPINRSDWVGEVNSLQRHPLPTPRQSPTPGCVRMSIVLALRQDGVNCLVAFRSGGQCQPPSPTPASLPYPAPLTRVMCLGPFTHLPSIQSHIERDADSQARLKCLNYSNHVCFYDGVPATASTQALAAINTAVPKIRRAAVAERLARSPPTKANRVQFPSGSPDFLKCESCRTMPLFGGSSRGSPASPAPHSGAARHSPQSPSSALETSLLRAAQISSLQFRGAGLKSDRDAGRLAGAPGGVAQAKRGLFPRSMRARRAYTYTYTYTYATASLPPRPAAQRHLRLACPTLVDPRTSAAIVVDVPLFSCAYRHSHDHFLCMDARNYIQKQKLSYRILHRLKRFSTLRDKPVASGNTEAYSPEILRHACTIVAVRRARRRSQLGVAVPSVLRAAVWRRSRGPTPTRVLVRRRSPACGRRSRRPRRATLTVTAGTTAASTRPRRLRRRPPARRQPRTRPDTMPDRLRASSKYRTHFPPTQGPLWLDYSPPTCEACENRAGRQVFWGISRFPHPCILALIYTHLASPPSALKTSKIRPNFFTHSLILHSFPASVCTASHNEELERVDCKGGGGAPSTFETSLCCGKETPPPLRGVIILRVRTPNVSWIRPPRRAGRGATRVAGDVTSRGHDCKEAQRSWRRSDATRARVKARDARCRGVGTSSARPPHLTTLSTTVRGATLPLPSDNSPSLTGYVSRTYYGAKTLVLRGATVADQLVCSPPTKAIRAQFPAGSLRIFCIWGSLVYPALLYRRCSILTSITLIGSQDLDLLGAAVVQRLGRSPPTKPDLVRFSVISLRIFALHCKKSWENYLTSEIVLLIGWLSRGSPVSSPYIPRLLHTHLATPSSALKRLRSPLFGCQGLVLDIESQCDDSRKISIFQAKERHIPRSMEGEMVGNPMLDFHTVSEYLRIQTCNKRPFHELQPHMPNRMTPLFSEVSEGFSNHRLLTYFPASSSANREFSAACTPRERQSDTKPISRDSCSQWERLHQRNRCTFSSTYPCILRDISIPAADTQQDQCFVAGIQLNSSEVAWRFPWMWACSRLREALVHGVVSDWLPPVAKGSLLASKYVTRR